MAGLYEHQMSGEITTDCGARHATGSEPGLAWASRPSSPAPVIGLQRPGPGALNPALTTYFVEDRGSRGVYVRDTEQSEDAEPNSFELRKAVFSAWRVRAQRADCGSVPRARSPPSGRRREGHTGDGILAAEKLGAHSIS